MLPFPVPTFEQQRLEVLQRYRLLSPMTVENAGLLAEVTARAAGWPMVFAAVTARHRGCFACHHGLPETHRALIASFCHRAKLADEPFFVPDARDDPHFAGHAAVTGGPELRAFAGTPMRTRDGERLGTLCLLSSDAARPPDAALLGRLSALTAEALVYSSAARYAVCDLIEAERVKRDFYDLAMLDPLTGVLNRRAFREVSGREVGRSARHARPLTVLALDIDHFKLVNDRHGHAVGDVVLKAVAACLRANLRDEDAIGRVGGEEFAVVMPETEAAAAQHTADRLRRLVSAMRFQPESGALRVTVSMGLSEVRRGEADLRLALCRADKALYAAKAAGRDRVLPFAETSAVAV